MTIFICFIDTAITEAICLMKPILYVKFTLILLLSCYDMDVDKWSIWICFCTNCNSNNINLRSKYFILQWLIDWRTSYVLWIGECLFFVWRMNRVQRSNIFVCLLQVTCIERKIVSQKFKNCFERYQIQFFSISITYLSSLNAYFLC